MKILCKITMKKHIVCVSGVRWHIISAGMTELSSGSCITRAYRAQCFVLRFLAVHTSRVAGPRVVLLRDSVRLCPLVLTHSLDTRCHHLSLPVLKHLCNNAYYSTTQKPSYTRAYTYAHVYSSIFFYLYPHG